MSNNFWKVLWIFTMAIALVAAFITVQNSFYSDRSTKIQQEPPEVVVNIEEVQCVQQALWHEARGESKEGIKAVLSVIVNRTKSKHYPDTFCEVIHEPKQFSYVDELRKKGESFTPKVKESEQDVYSCSDEDSLL